MEHIVLSVNILCQLWKARNERVFKEYKRPPIKIIQKAQRERLEFQEAVARDRKMSMPETRAGTTQQGSRGRDNSIHLSIVVKTQGNGGQMGIGILTENEDSKWQLNDP